MPPIEAMLFDTIVITTDRTCIPEITQNKANYVEDPFAEEWVRVMKQPQNRVDEVDFLYMSKEKLTEDYYHLLKAVWVKSSFG